ncbi:MAG: PspC domain-containing protein [Bacteroidales bacterium]|jgi:phage shock protein PspC (stress-responsive transcriptional regulator)|nr:PspC domain-containing protein [Bacteroidales bacterium]
MENTYEPWRRSRNKVIAGVCGGIAERLRIDPVVVRLIFLLLLVFAGGGFLAYIILWIVLPEAPYAMPTDDSHTTANYTQDASNEGSEKEPLPQMPIDETSKKRTQLVLGLVLIGLGVLFLVAAFIPRFNMFDLWPVALIVFGVFILKSGKQF